MASRKKQPPLKNRPNTIKHASEMDASSSDGDDDDVEMEQNFALFSKRSSLQTAEATEGDSGDEEDGASLAESSEDEDGPTTTEPDNEEAAQSGDEEEADDGSDPPSEVHPESEQDHGESSSDSEDPHEGGRTNLQTEDGVKRELSTMSFKEIMELQNKMGSKAYNKIAYGPTRTKQPAQPMKRLSKHKPQEISSKLRVPFLRKVVQAKKPLHRDPRFDDLSGEYKPEIFDQTYKFINDIRHREKEMVKKTLKKVKSQSKKETMKVLLKRMENQERERQRSEQQREKELQFKRQQRELVHQGHRPFYLKKSDKKKLELAEKYSNLKKSGKLENFMSKKRKRNATKDRRKLPNQHKAH